MREKAALNENTHGFFLGGGAIRAVPVVCPFLWALVVLLIVGRGYILFVVGVTFIIPQPRSN